MKTNISSTYLIRRCDVESVINVTKDVCKIYNNFPKDFIHIKSALHDAENRGCLEVCKLIIDNVEDANPKNGHRYTTPLHLAAR